MTATTMDKEKSTKALRRMRKANRSAANKLAAKLGGLGLEETASPKKKKTAKKKRQTAKASKSAEQRAFELAYKNLNERERNKVIQVARKRKINKKNCRKTRAVTFKEATFDTNKSTKELLDETTDQVNNLGGIGTPEPMRWTQRLKTHAPTQQEQRKKASSNNPFDAIAEHGEEEPRAFTFAPSSFAVPTLLVDPDPDL